MIIIDFEQKVILTQGIFKDIKVACIKDDNNISSMHILTWNETYS